MDYRILLLLVQATTIIETLNLPTIIRELSTVLVIPCVLTVCEEEQADV